MKTIFITGASSGIGKATTELFAKNGWRVIATMRNTAKGADLTQLENIIVMDMDVTNNEQVHKVTQEVIETYGVDVVFSNAGYGIKGAFEQIPIDKMQEIYDVNLFGMKRVFQEFIPYMKKIEKDCFYRHPL